MQPLAKPSHKVHSHHSIQALVAGPTQALTNSSNSTLAISHKENLATRLQNLVWKLCESSRGSLNYSGMHEAAKIITQEWKQMGFKYRLLDFYKKQDYDIIPESELNKGFVAIQKFKAADKMRSRNSSANIIGYYKNLMVSVGAPQGKRYVIGAHYDAFVPYLTDRHADNYNENCKLYQGANDNASGVAVLLELTRELKKHEEYFKQKNIRIDFVAYANEEPPFFRDKDGQDMGSYRHARELRSQGAELEGMICLDMLGYYDSQPGSQKPLPNAPSDFPKTGDFLLLLGRKKHSNLINRVKNSIKQHLKTYAYKASPKQEFQELDFSDHKNYEKFGYRNLLATDSMIFRTPGERDIYHSINDTPEKLNYQNMARIVRGLVEFFKSLD